MTIVNITDDYRGSIIRDAIDTLNLAAGSIIWTSINGIDGALIRDRNNANLLFLAYPVQFDPNGVWVWFGPHIAAANLAAFNYDIVVDINITNQRFFKIQGLDGVQLQVAADTVGFEIIASSGLVHSGGPLEITAPASNVKAGFAGFTDSLILGQTHSPTSAGTAGKLGEMTFDGSNLYICTQTGTAGNAIWKKTALTQV